MALDVWIYTSTTMLKHVLELGNKSFSFKLEAVCWYSLFFLTSNIFCHLNLVNKFNDNIKAQFALSARLLLGVDIDLYLLRLYLAFHGEI